MKKQERIFICYRHDDLKKDVIKQTINKLKIEYPRLSIDSNCEWGDKHQQTIISQLINAAIVIIFQTDCFVNNKKSETHKDYIWGMEIPIIISKIRHQKDFKVLILEFNKSRLGDELEKYQKLVIENLDIPEEIIQRKELGSQQNVEKIAQKIKESIPSSLPPRLELNYEKYIIVLGRMAPIELGFNGKVNVLWAGIGKSYKELDAKLTIHDLLIIKENVFALIFANGIDTVDVRNFTKHSNILKYYLEEIKDKLLFSNNKLSDTQLILGALRRVYLSHMFLNLKTVIDYSIIDDPNCTGLIKSIKETFETNAKSKFHIATSIDDINQPFLNTYALYEKELKGLINFFRSK